MREAWDRPPAPANPGLMIFTAHMVPEVGRTHMIRHGADCWCEPQVQWCDEGCCRIIAHAIRMTDG